MYLDDGNGSSRTWSPLGLPQEVNAKTTDALNLTFCCVFSLLHIVHSKICLNEGA